MSVIDTLEILVEADSRGLETQLKRSSDTVVSFVKKMNSEEVNWQKVLAGSLYTAVIAGVASMFAQAIGQFVQFQSAAMNLNNIATPATKDFASSVNKLGGEAYNLADQAGLKIGDATASFEAFSKAGLNSAAAMTATTAAAGIARETGQSLTQVVSELSGLFQAWGVVTNDQVNSALDGLVNAASMGKFSFEELVTTITDQGANLAKKTNISDVAVSLALLSDQSGLTKKAVVDSFTDIGNSVTDQVNGMNALLGGPGSVGDMISSGPHGLITAFEKIKTRLDNTAPAVRNVIGQQMGLATDDVASFSNTSIDNLNRVEKKFDEVHDHLTPWPQVLAEHESAMNKLTVSWNKFINALDKFVVPAGIFVVSKILDGLRLMLEAIVGSVKDAVTHLAELFNLGKDSPLVKTLESLGVKIANGVQDGVDWVDNKLGIGKTIAQRLNNPGDLKYVGQAGASLGDKGFAAFSSFADGFKALENDLLAKIKRNGSTTLLDFAKVYAPSSDGNNPLKYAQDLASQLGASINTPIEALRGSLEAFARAVAHNEDGSNPNLAGLNKTANLYMNVVNNNQQAPSAQGTNLAHQLYNEFVGLF